MTALATGRWLPVCDLGDLQPERGVAVLAGNAQVALFRTWSGQLFAVANRDPYSGANVLARGIVGTRSGRDVVISPMYKQAFDLATGQAVDDPAVCLPVFGVRAGPDGTVQVAVP